MFDIGEVHRARYGRMKRILDVVAGFVGLVGYDISARGINLPSALRLDEGDVDFVVSAVRDIVNSA